ncbi:hypothetical protein [Sphingomonas sp. LT1P40]|uniref:hypothetical protein n=1 Tax=Alteristakelama amylovorans TaxID=3096166 RepID=UPI002FC94632
MTEVVDGQASVERKAWLTVLCWILGTAYILAGFGNLLGFPQASGAAGLVRIAGGIVLLPPILRRIENHFPLVRRAWAILLFAFVVLPIMLLLVGPSLTFTPLQTAAERPGPGISSATAVSPSVTPVMPSPSKLKAAQRFGEIPADHMLRPVQDALNAGDVDLSLRLLSERNALDDADRPLKQRLIAAIQKASDEQIGRDPGVEYAERIDSYWLPQVRALPSTAPESDEAFGKLRTSLAGIAADVEDNAGLKLSGEQALKRKELIDALAAKQRSLFPAMRRRYAKALDAKLFRRDIRVVTTGTGDSTLLVTGRLFSFNANIEDTQNVIREAATSLRFKKVSYRWSAHIDKRTTYDLNVPSDPAIGR